MRKLCVQVVESSGKLLGKVGSLCTGFATTKHLGDKSRDLCHSFSQRLPTDFHSKTTVVTTVYWLVLPTIHTTYKSKQKIKLNLYSY